MKRFFIRFLHGVFLLAFLHGQPAFAVPSIVSLTESDCGRHMDSMSADPHHDHHHAFGNNATPCEHGQQAGHQACDEDNGPCDHSCKGDGCCGGCNVCGYCPIALVTAFQARIPSCGYRSGGVILPPQDLHPSPIFQPPRDLLQS